ncbi:MAG: high-potential iron-sulfur protein [Akkermansiaceae bacterium]|nr:high-potential iron-sulfur protein [Akkermansiaceae bacterium]MCF7733728.1 high-potential iron-sulfur protein [Akkermansiaceae bacterium]
MNSRRTFLLSLVASAGTPALLASRVLAQAPPPPVKLEESDPIAMALGFKLDTAKVDAKKYPQHSVAQKCSECAVYQAKAGDTLGPCVAIGNKLVPAGGWCVAFSKKPASGKKASGDGVRN